MDVDMVLTDEPAPEAREAILQHLIMRQAEAEAIGRGCIGACLDTSIFNNLSGATT